MRSSADQSWLENEPAIDSFRSTIEVNETASASETEEVNFDVKLDKGTKRRGRTHRLDSICRRSWRRYCFGVRVEESGAELGARWVAGQGRALP